MKESVDLMTKKIRKLEERDFLNTKAELEGDISQVKASKYYEFLRIWWRSG